MFDLAEVATPEWTDFNDADLGVVIVQAFSAGFDVLSYYVDRLYNERIPTTAILGTSIYPAAGFLGYTPNPRTASTVFLDVTVDPLTAVFTLSKGYRFGSEASPEAAIGEQEFTLDEDVTFPINASEQTQTVRAVHGKLINDEILGSGTSSPFEFFALKNKPYCHHPIDGHNLVLEARDSFGVWNVWDLVSHFQDSGPNDHHFRLFPDEDGGWYVQCSDGLKGALFPTGPENIRASYRVGGGKLSVAIGANKITKNLDGDSRVNAVTNNAPPFGGTNAESLLEIRRNLPGFNRRLDTLFLPADFEAAADQLRSFVTKAVPGPRLMDMTLYCAPYPDQLMSFLENKSVLTRYFSQSNGVQRAFNFVASSAVRSYNLWERADYDLVNFLGQQLRNEIEKKKIPATRVLFLPAALIEIDAKYRIMLDDDITWSAARRLLYENLAYAVLSGRLPYKIGYPLKLRDVDNVLEGVSQYGQKADNGIQQVDVLRFRRVPYARPVRSSSGFYCEFVSVSDDYKPTKDVTWEIRYLGSGEIAVMKDSKYFGTYAFGTTVTIEETISGVSTELFSFLTSERNRPAIIGDIAHIRVGRYVGDIQVDPWELALPIMNRAEFEFDGGIED